MKLHGFSSKWTWGALVVACAIGVFVGARSLGKAKVSGDTPEERIASVIELANDRPRGAAESLAETARNDPDASVRRVALVCLNRFQRQDDRGTVMAATHDDDPQVRQAASRALMAYADEETVRRLTVICRDDANARVRNAAFIALGINASPHAIVTLVEMMEHADTRELRLAAAEAMIDKFNMASVPNPDDRLEWEEFIEAIKLDSVVQAAFDETGTQLIHDKAAAARHIEKHARLCHPETLETALPEHPVGEE